MLSTATEGGQMINFSPRFSLTGMTGSTPPSALTAIAALGGATTARTAINQVANNAGAAAGGGAAAAPQTGEFTIAYGLQTGLTKYAPMQPVPPTKITKKNPTPLNPTSAYTIATTFMPQATILTTLTASQTFSVSSMENTVCLSPTSSEDELDFEDRADMNIGCCCRRSIKRYATVPEPVEGLGSCICDLSMLAWGMVEYSTILYEHALIGTLASEGVLGVTGEA
jgi:hypothetical protein